MSINTYRDYQKISQAGMWAGAAMVIAPPVVTFAVRESKHIIKLIFIDLIMNFLVSGPWVVTYTIPKPVNVDFLWACSKHTMKIGAAVSVVSVISFLLLDLQIKRLEPRTQDEGALI